MVKSWSFKEKIRSLRPNIVDHVKRKSDSSPPHEINQDQFMVRRRWLSQTDVWRALSPSELPDRANFALTPPCNLSPEICASGTGPNSGLLVLQKWSVAKNLEKSLIDSWRVIKNRKAHGISVSLYEKNPLSGRLSGEPLADAFVFRARRDSAFLAVADGVNWGRDSMQAARCAIYSVYEYIEAHLYGPQAAECQVTNVKEAAQLLFETFSAAQDRIVSCTSGLTTLCVALVLPVFDPLTQPVEVLQPRQFALIVASVGDSQAYLLSKCRGIREVTGSLPTVSRVPNGVGSTIVDRLNNAANAKVSVTTGPPRMRDFRDTGGALGPVYENGNPELDNLICAVTLCDPGDIVILGSDGLTDNFDPVITKVAVAESPQLDFVDATDVHGHRSSSDSIDLPAVDMPTFLPPKSWSNPFRISPPGEISIWPRPPPPPDESPELTDTAMRVPPQANHCSDSEDLISARSLNFTNQLEMTWMERRRYAEKSIERVWHETDACVTSPNGRGGVASSKDLCEALISEVVRVTAEKRKLLQDPDLARLRMHPDKLKRLNIPLPEEDLGSPAAADAKRKWLNDTLKLTPGKLDHATVVAYEVGVYNGNENEDYEANSLRVRSCDLSTMQN